MLNYLFLVLSASLGATKSILSKTTKNDSVGFKGTLKTNGISYFFAFVAVYIIYICTSGFLIKAPIGLSIAYAVCTMLAQLCLLLAVGSGPVSISVLFYSCGFIIPTIWGSIKYGEGVNVFHIIGLVLILLSFVLGANYDKKGNGFSIKWLIVAFGGFIFSGLLGVIQKFFVMNETDYSLNGFICFSLLLTFVIDFIVLIFATFLSKKSSKKIIDFSNINKKYIICTILLGIVLGAVNVLNTSISGMFPSAVAFPSINGGSIILTTIFSAIIFKEKISKKQIAGVIVGFIGIVVISLATLY